jgi:hypothetical protein
MSLSIQCIYQDSLESKQVVGDLILERFTGITPIIDDFSVPLGKSIILYHKGYPVGVLKVEDAKLSKAVNEYIKKSECFLDMGESLDKRYRELQDSVAFDLHRRIPYSCLYRGNPEARDIRVSKAFSYIWNEKGELINY